MSDIYKIQYNGMTLTHPGWEGYLSYEDKPKLLYLSYFKDAHISGNTFTDVPLIMDSRFTPMSGNISGFSFSVNRFNSHTDNIPDSYITKSVTYIRGSAVDTDHGEYQDVLTWTFPLTSEDVFSITWRAARVNRWVEDCLGFKVSANYNGIWSYGMWTYGSGVGSNGNLNFYGSGDFELFNGSTIYSSANSARIPTTNVDVRSGKWSNYALVSDGTGSLWIYVNGLLYLRKKNFNNVDLSKFFFGGVGSRPSTYGGMLTELAVYPFDISINNHNNVPVLDDIISV